MKGVRPIKLSKRQEKIIEIVKDEQPISSEAIAQKLLLSRSALRSDLAILTMSGILDARPKIGYLYKGSDQVELASERIRNRTVGEFMGVPLLINEKLSAAEGIVQLFMADVDSVFVTDDDNKLIGLVSKKDFLKFSLSEGDFHEIPLALIMTRKPNLVTVSENESLIEAVRAMVDHEVDALPVMRGEEVVGRFSKSNLTRFFLEIAGD